MIGLEFVCKTYSMEYKTLAESLGVSPATIQDWLKMRRKIPLQRLEQLSEIFSIDEKYFQKELSRVEELDIQLAYLYATEKEEKHQYIDYDDDGNEILLTHTEYQNRDEIEHMEKIKDRRLVLEKISELVFLYDSEDYEEIERGDRNFAMLKNFAVVVQRGSNHENSNLKSEEQRCNDLNKIRALEVCLALLAPQTLWGGTPPTYTKFQREFRDLLIKFLGEYDIIKIIKRYDPFDDIE